MKKIIITAISAIAVIASVIGCQIYDSQTNETLASAMNKDGQGKFQKQELFDDFNATCSKLIDNSSDTEAYNKIVDMYMGFDKFNSAATSAVGKIIDNMSNAKMNQEEKNKNKHDSEYILTTYKEKYMTKKFLYDTYREYISSEYEALETSVKAKENLKVPTAPTEPAKYTDPDNGKKNQKKPVAPTLPVIPSLIVDLSSDDASNDAANHAAYEQYKADMVQYETDYSKYEIEQDKYERSQEYLKYLDKLDVNSVNYYKAKYLSDLAKYESDRAKYIDKYSDFVSIQVVANKNSKADSTFSIVDLYVADNKLNWDYNSKK